MKKLLTKREQIDSLDQKISKLLIQRRDLSHDIIRKKRKLKLPITDADREREIIQKISEAREPAEKNYLVEVYRVIFRSCKKSRR